ncbi:MAG: hypothetical protein IJI46_06860 [Erysipelotrichaceae bacterium]|nr:hypothetical protein [Erysipelotrichaceae bacterium]
MMRFGWINLFGAIIVMVMLIPNVIYAFRNKDEKNRCTRLMNLIEQIGRYACIVLMWFPLSVGKFGFSSVEEFLIYLTGNGILLFAYFLYM